MADPIGPKDSANRRAQIIADQALREAAAAPTNWRAARKRRSWNTPKYSTEPLAQPASPAAGSSVGPAAKM